mmetsp:Transcript_12506/g.22982  ORF Transcript_12506/g.22982 Transcript_12506/m.22982 type:complete len:113 (+) Transcript_12506:1013-1351(+)
MLNTTNIKPIEREDPGCPEEKELRAARDCVERRLHHPRRCSPRRAQRTSCKNYKCSRPSNRPETGMLEDDPQSTTSTKACECRGGTKLVLVACSPQEGACCCKEPEGTPEPS